MNQYEMLKSSPLHELFSMIILDNYLLVAQCLHSKLAMKQITCFPTVDFFDMPPPKVYIMVLSTTNGHVSLMKWAYFHKVYNRFNTSMGSLCYYKEFGHPWDFQ